MRPRFQATGRALVILALVASPSLAEAQANPTFQFGKPDEVKKDQPPKVKIEWKVQAKAGLLLTSGNSQSDNATVGLDASRKEGNNKLAFGGGLAYGRSTLITPLYNPAMPTEIDGIARQSVTTTNNWFSKGRYDRFFTTNNAGYASAQAAADRIAGKTFYGGGQAGYSRQLVNSALQVVVVELGYDFSYERYSQQPNKTLDPVSIHSARLFAGDTLKLTAATGISASLEALFNLNKEGAALNVDNGQPGVDAFEDTRLIGKAALTTNLRKQLSIAFGFTLRYDQNPAPLPLPSGAVAGAAFAPGWQPFADKVDTMTEATLIYTFL
jgi:putative salt-induced outer membrane protein YdiY